MGEKPGLFTGNADPADWRDIPVVLGGVKHGFVDYRTELGEDSLRRGEVLSMEKSFDDFKVTGYYNTDYIIENIGLVKKLQPEVTDIAFCFGSRYHHTLFKNYLSETFRMMRIFVFTFGLGISFPQWLWSILSLK